MLILMHILNLEGVPLLNDLRFTHLKLYTYLCPFYHVKMLILMDILNLEGVPLL
jgi:hypothetical protein